MYNNGNSSKNVTGASIVDGTVTNADIDASAAIAQSKLATLVITNSEVADNALSGDKIDAGIISNFQSTGIDDRESTSISLTMKDGYMKINPSRCDWGGALVYTRLAANNSGSSILASVFGDSPSVGWLYAVETGTSNYLIARFYKQGTSSSAVVSVLSSSGLSLGSYNSGGTQILNGASVGTNVRMQSIIRRTY
jgi:hypothetical protein